jgi:hypothetical protein
LSRHSDFFYGLEVPKSQRPLLERSITLPRKEFLANRTSPPGAIGAAPVRFLEVDDGVGLVQLVLQLLVLALDNGSRTRYPAEAFCPSAIV